MFNRVFTNAITYVIFNIFQFLALNEYYSKNVLKDFFYYWNPILKILKFTLLFINKNQNSHFINQIFKKNVDDKKNLPMRYTIYL